MTQFFRQFRIGQRIWLLTFGLGAVVIAFSLWLAGSLHRGLLEEKMNAVDTALNTAEGILEHYEAQARAGVMSEEQAQAAALKVIGTIRYLGDNYLWINDLDYVWLMHPVKPELVGKNLRELKDKAGKPFVQELVEGVRSRGRVQVEYLWPRPGEQEPVAKLSQARAFRPWAWMVASGIHPGDVEAAVNREILPPLLAGGVILLLLGGFSLLLVRSITQPLEQTVARLEQAAGGRTDLTVRLPAEGRDELARMAGSFNTLIGAANQVVRGVAEANRKLLAAGEGLAGVTASAQQQAQRQQAETASLAAAMNEMVATVQEVARSAQLAADSTQKTEAEAGGGRRVVQDTMAAIENLSQELDRSRQIVQQLAEDSNSIGTVLDVINGVAEQTNLLALNAAIEAARAGEQGRGFAVVADEVRTLASRTQQSTKEIQDIIERLQAGAKRAVDSMAENAGRAHKTVEESARAGDALSAITAAVSTISDMNNQIASAAEEQTATAEEINRSVTSIRDSAGAAGDTVARTLAASEELRQLARTLSAQLDRLSA